MSVISGYDDEGQSKNTSSWSTPAFGLKNWGNFIFVFYSDYPVCKKRSLAQGMRISSIL